MGKRDAREEVQRLRAAGILTVRYYQGSGPGGQHRNRTESGVELSGQWTLDGAPLRIVARACLKSQGASLVAALGEACCPLKAKGPDPSGPWIGWPRRLQARRRVALDLSDALA